jgi:hypothetical protein
MKTACAAPEQIWLAVSDVHLDMFGRSSRPSPYGLDTNKALFESAVVQMKRAAPHPTVVLIAGDFLMHGFAKRAVGGSGPADEAALESMRWIAATLGRTFPKAQFAIAIGNNDVPCGDYRSAARSPYLAGVARVWNALIDRGGASPEFESSFLRGGYYTARLPVRGLQLVVLDTVPLSSEYRGNCGGGIDPASEELTWFRKVLRETPPGTRNVVLMHIPPGFDAFATEYARGFIAWPFLQMRYNTGLLNALQSFRTRVFYAIAGHAHRFDFRLAGSVPIVILGALSPVYANNPVFYALHVERDGSLRDIDAYDFDEARQQWLRPHSFDRTWGLQRVDVLSLRRVHAKLAASPASRTTWIHQAAGWSSALSDSLEPWGNGWRVAWCAQNDTSAGFAACAGVKPRVKMLVTLGFFAVAAAASLIVIFISLPRLRR